MNYYNLNSIYKKNDNLLCFARKNKSFFLNTAQRLSNVIINLMNKLKQA